ncbi:MAG: site-specific integrase [Muribaculum sp.]|nr:site-specific integrase [Muribaculaceae bacterium]MCM1081395.1 site-specific integrase [Muribaculum sp.]
MNLRIVILKAKQRADGSHKIRIAVSHNSTTRYIPTRFSVDGERNLRNGVVVNMPNASYINQQLRTELNKIYTIFDTLEDRDVYTCTQLIKVIKHKMTKGTIRTVEEINFEFLRIKQHSWSEGTMRLHKDGIKRFIDYAGKNFILSMLDSAMLYSYKAHLKSLGMSETTIGIRIGVIRRLVYFATTHGYAKYDIPPFYDYKEKIPVARDIALSLDQLREVRDMEISGKWEQCARDIFMLSFYMCGMNMADLLEQDLSKPTVKFIRVKTRSRRNPNEFTEFTIQPEARAIINKYICEDGKLRFYGRETKKSIQHITDDYIRKIRAELGFDKMVYYSARKTFAQLANELMIKDTVIEYCIGDAPSNPRRALNFYIKINKRIADKAIRKVFDAVASDKSLEQLMTEADI